MTYMPFRNLVGLLVLLSAAATAPAQSNLQDPNTVVATVNGEEIKSPEYVHRMEWYQVDPKNQLAALPNGFLTIKQLISEHLIFQMAKAKGVYPSAPEIDAAEQEEIARVPSLLTDLQKSGRPESDLRYDLAYQLAQFNLQTFGITITDQEVEQHFQQYPTEFTTPKRYKLRVIVVTDDASQATVDKDLAAGKSFSEVAQNRSEDVSKANGGEFGEVPETELSTPVRTALSTVKIGQTSAWVRGNQQSDQARVKYLVEDVKASEKQTLDAGLRKRIRRKLMLDRGNVKNQVFKDLKDETLKAKVVINQPQFQRIYDQLLKQLGSTPAGQ